MAYMPVPPVFDESMTFEEINARDMDYILVLGWFRMNNHLSPSEQKTLDEYEKVTLPQALSRSQKKKKKAKSHVC